jgi:ATP-dependent protease ClpP protease subunit
MWASKKRKPPPPAGDDSDDDSSDFRIVMPKLGSSTNVYSSGNHVYFNDTITEESAFALNRELRNAKMRATVLAVSSGITSPLPIFLHLTTPGGCIHSAFTVVDCIGTLGVPVHTIVEGSVASAGTLISMAGQKRYIMQNAYMLIHELRSGVWGKMSTLHEEMKNLDKVMDHLYTYYCERSKLRKPALVKLLTKDVIWNASESISKGIVEEVYTGV